MLKNYLSHTKTRGETNMAIDKRQDNTFAYTSFRVSTFHRVSIS